MKLVKEYINEKFIEDSDPIKDMNIGIMHDIIKFVEDNKMIKNEENYDKNHLLLTCAKYDKTEFIKFLLENGADIHSYNDNTLHWAVHHKNIELVKYLLNKGANIHSNYERPLGIAKYNNDDEMIKLLKDNGAIDKPDIQKIKDIKKEGRRLFKINKKLNIT